jgi:hypothetical protein
LRWYEIDTNWYGIWLLKKLGLAKQVHVTKLESLKRNEPAAEEAGQFAAAEPQPELVSAQM